MSTFLSHLLVDGPLGCFHLLAIANCAVIHIAEKVSLMHYFIALGRYPVKRLLDCMAIQFAVLTWASILLSIRAIVIYTSITVDQGSLFFTSVFFLFVFFITVILTGERQFLIVVLEKFNFTFTYILYILWRGFSFKTPTFWNGIEQTWALQTWVISESLSKAFDTGVCVGQK